MHSATQSFHLCSLYLLHTFPLSGVGAEKAFLHCFRQVKALQSSLVHCVLSGARSVFSLVHMVCCLWCRVLSLVQSVLQIALLAPPDPTARLKLAALFSLLGIFSLVKNCQKLVWGANLNLIVDSNFPNSAGKTVWLQKALECAPDTCVHDRPSPRFFEVLILTNW